MRLGWKKSLNVKEDFWALKDVAFEIKQGERVGVIGGNGAGKSTLLKLLSRITEPSTGRISINGRIASLLEVGTGFHPELTGRENIYLNGAILGMTRSEIKRKFDEIVAFSEVNKFLDTPVKRYSSGMYVRLAFAVAAHLEPEILIVDEVLAVGDAQFQKKCLGKMEEVGREGRTVLFVSHNMAAIQALCSRGIVLQNGIIISDDDVKMSIGRYLSNDQKTHTKDLANVQRLARHCTGEARITAFSIRNIDSQSDLINADKPCIAEIYFEVFHDNTSVGAEFTLSDDFQKLSWFQSYARNGLVPAYTKGIHKLVCNLSPLSLLSGEYYVTLALSRPGVPIDYIERAQSIDIELPHREGMLAEYKRAVGNGCVYLEHKWEMG